MLQNFSKLSREEKIKALVQELELSSDTGVFLDQFRYKNPEIQAILSELSENTLTNFPFPYGIAPNFLINNKLCHVPMVTEESSVVAAASKAAKIWMERGGFRAHVKSLNKTGQVHFLWYGHPEKLKQTFPALEKSLMDKVEPLTERMRRRGGGIKSLELVDKTNQIASYYQLFVSFDTADAMGANFINSCLEALAAGMVQFIQEYPDFTEEEKKVEVVMSILSNYNPDCLVETYVECPIEKLNGLYAGFTPQEYASRFKLAVDIARSDVYRATTHNKGIFNGIDAVTIATGNDYRALEAGAHAYASRNGHYQSLSQVEVSEKIFRFSLEMPMTIGTVGGITAIHPLTKFSLQVLGNPDARELMGIISSVGLASNFAAVHALITSGIQKGHMKMHLSNILTQLKANEKQKESAKRYFENKVVSFNDVEKFLNLEDRFQNSEDRSF